MARPPLADDQRLIRKSIVETLLRDGYTPPGTTGGKGSALEEANRRVGWASGVFQRWVNDEIRKEAEGRGGFIPDWSLYRLESSSIAEVDEEPEVTPEEHAQARARSLAAEITSLVTRSNYPLVNPEAIIVDSYVARKYDREIQDYVLKEGTPRTWLTDTLRVAPVVDPRNRKYIFTGAQNDAPLDHKFWANLKAYAEWIGAEIVVGAWTYETNWWSENNPTSRAYADELSDYICFGQMAIGDNFIFAGEMNTLPTAAAPISDLVTYSRSKWAVFPHAKRQLKSVPSTDPNIQAHQVMTTGSVTRPKVIPRKAGVKSLFHQTIGAVIVEFDADGDIFCRQISAAKDSSFYDLDRHVKDGVVTTGHRAKALVVGDLHIRKLDAANAMATFGFDQFGSEARYKNSVIDVLNPEEVIAHDIFDNESRNHHHVNDNAYSYEMAYRGRDSVAEEISGVVEFLIRLKDRVNHIIVVESNHDIGLDRWVREGRYRNDGNNIRLGLQMEDAYLQYVEDRSNALDFGGPMPRFSLLEHAIKTTEPELKDVEWAHDGYSRLIDGIEVGHHGFRGVNGAKGTIAGFARVGRRMTIADKHSPEINEGVFVAGCMQLRHGYNKGPSSWAIAHVVQYADGSRSLITLQSGKWRAERPRIGVPAAKAA